MAFGDLTYCSVYVGTTNIFNEEGTVSFDLGEPAAENTSKSGAKGTYAIIDDVENCLYRNASITVLAGSYMNEYLSDLYQQNNYGSETVVALSKNDNRASTLATDKTIFKIRCVKNPGKRTGYSVTGNNDDVAYVTYGLELYLSSEAII